MAAQTHHHSAHLLPSGSNLPGVNATVDRGPLDPASQQMLQRGRSVIRSEIAVLEIVEQNLDCSFSDAVRMVLACRGSVIITGMGKAGIVGQKLVASLSSTGTPSHFMHPAEAIHGDLGCIRGDDVVIVLSYSGETEEVTRLLPMLCDAAAGTIAITAKADSTLGKGVDVAILVGKHSEACLHNLAPTCSTTSMLAVGDALALVVSEQRGFTREQFARYHPGGHIGKRLTLVHDIMRPLSECRLASDSLTVREVMIHVSRPGRRTGAVMLTDDSGRLTGIFTDGDLAKLLERDASNLLDQPVAKLMSRDVQIVAPEVKLEQAMIVLAHRKLSELPVIDDDRVPLGILDVTDVVTVLSPSGVSDDSPQSPASLPTHLSGEPRILSLAEHQRRMGRPANA